LYAQKLYTKIGVLKISDWLILVFCPCALFGKVIQQRRHLGLDAGQGIIGGQQMEIGHFPIENLFSPSGQPRFDIRLMFRAIQRNHQRRFL
jgi:hypothetical protein